MLWLSAWIGATRFRGFRAQIAERHDDFGIIQGATLTLLGLIIGFTFSMAMGRYDQRKNYEEEEANAIGTEYLRADMLPAADAAKVRALLVRYLDQRVLFYTVRDEQQIREINAETGRLQAQLWSAVVTPAIAQPTPLTALATAGMNDVLNTQGYTQAAWWNRVPIAAWSLMSALAICATLLVGMGAKSEKPELRLLLIVPLVVSSRSF